MECGETRTRDKAAVRNRPQLDPSGMMKGTSTGFTAAVIGVLLGAGVGDASPLLSALWMASVLIIGAAVAAWRAATVRCGWQQGACAGASTVVLCLPLVLMLGGFELLPIVGIAIGGAIGVGAVVGHTLTLFKSTRKRSGVTR